MTSNDHKNECYGVSFERSDTSSTSDIVNTSGHVQELDRNFGIWSISAMGVVADNAWASGGGSLVLALYNGGGPGVMYGLIAATFFYCFIGASLAELASAIPSSSNVYHWASVAAGPRYGRAASFFAGWWNCLAWIFGTAGPCAFGANALIALYALYHPGYTPQNWQIFIAYIGILAMSSALVLFGQRILARASAIAGVFCLAFFLATVLINVIMTPSNGSGYASNAFVWTEFQNLTGWSSNGFVFLLGILNGAYAIGTPDAVTHLCEEIPKPRVNIPWGIVAQLGVGFLTTFAFNLATLYGINSLEDVQNTNITSFPLAAIYQQATGSTSATAALLIIFFLDVTVSIPGPYVTAGRALWTLARDDAVPFSPLLRHVSKTWRNPFRAQLVVSGALVILGCIYIGSTQAFNAFVGVFIILSTMSYATAIIPYAITARKYVPAGPFHIPSPWAYVVFGVACTYIIVFDVIYMFPYVYPVDAASMNYNCVLAGGLTILLMLWYLYKRTRGYVGPTVKLDGRDDISQGLAGLTMKEEESRRQAHAAKT